MATRQPTDDELLRFLTGQDSAWLAGELLRAAACDPVLRARLDVAAGADAGAALDERHLRVRLERVIEIGDYVAYREAYSYAQDVEDELEQLLELIGQGFPDAAMRLAENALAALEGAAGMIDDSDGHVGALLSRAAEIHLEACAAGAPDPVRLAGYLVDSALQGDHEVFLDALHDYADVLGEEGLIAYRERVEAAWRALPPAKPGYQPGRFAVTHLMERLADLEGGTDAVVAIMARDVTSGYDLLRIAQRLCADGRDDEALAWLERGLAEFAPDGRLRSLAAECHLRAGRAGAAEELLWQNFAERPGLAAYIALHEAAADMAPWRPRALARLGQAPAITGRFSERPYLQGSGRSDLVEVLLWEDDVEAAWEAALAGGCRDELWLRLARARATAGHPADAIPILTAAAEQRIAHKDRAAYQVAAQLLVEAGAMFARCDRSEDFRSYLGGLRTAHRPKRALREELDRARLP